MKHTFSSQSSFLQPAKERAQLQFFEHLDIEWFLELDRKENFQKILERDRLLGKKAEADKEENWLRFWLEKRKQEYNTPTPGMLYLQTQKTVTLLLVLFSFFGGTLLTQGLLSYSGSSPVNVALFLLLTVFPQVLFMLLTLFRSFFKNSFRAFHGLTSLFFSKMFRSMHQKISKKIYPFFSFLQSQRRYRHIFTTHILRLTHLNGLFFSLGVLFCLLVNILVTDLAFGWQSTLQIGARGMERAVHLLALPWSWLPLTEGLLPTIEQIEGSRIILKDGVRALSSADLTAWWPFLCLCTLFYAVLPRTGLLVWMHFRARLYEKKLFCPDYSRIVDRMQHPILTTEPGIKEPQNVPLPISKKQKPFSQAYSCPLSPISNGTVVLLPEELEGRISTEDLDLLTRQVTGHEIVKTMPAPLDIDEAAAILEDCARLEPLRFFILTEAWQPPIREQLQTIQYLAQTRDTATSICLALIGRPQTSNWLTPPTAEEVESWKTALARLAPVRVDFFPVEAK